MTDARLQTLVSRYMECVGNQTEMAALHTWSTADLICLAKAIDEELHGTRGAV
jgi:hypothetical protein